MFKLLLLLSLWAACAYAAPILPLLSSGSYNSYHGHGWPSAYRVVRPIWTSHSIVHPISHGGYGYGYGWL